MALILFPAGHKYYGYAADPIADKIVSYKRNSYGDVMSGNSYGYFKINSNSVHRTDVIAAARKVFAEGNGIATSKAKLTTDAVAVSVKDKSSQFFSKGTSVDEIEAQLQKRNMLLQPDLILLDATTGAKIPFAVTRAIKLG